MEQLKAQIQHLTQAVADLAPDDIPALGQLLQDLSQLEKTAQSADCPPLTAALAAVQQQAEKLILEESGTTAALVAGVANLADIAAALENGQPLPDLSPEPADDAPPPTSPVLSADPAEDAEKNPGPPPSETNGADRDPPELDLSEEDLEIMAGFVAESQDNLESIEASLMELEETPGDLEIINTIFRPFHTIKGVAGFLNLDKINRLAHSAENLLDQARLKTLAVDQTVTNVILAAKDTLQQLIERVEEGVSAGRAPKDDDIDIKALNRQILDLLAQAKDQSGQDRLGEMLLRQGNISAQDLQAGIQAQQQNRHKRLGEILVDQQGVDPQNVNQALVQQKQKRRQPAKSQVRIDTDKLDNLVDLTGELVISQTMIRQDFQTIAREYPHLQTNLNQLKQIVSGIQKIAMAMRMVTISTTFQKMVRVVRDVAAGAGKQVGLSMSGEDTEIDRNVVDVLYQPLVHIMRNSVDHGLELPEERTAAGKPPKGTIHLAAYNRAGNIVIEIADDGRGLDKAAIRAKAIAQGLISEKAELTEEQTYELILKPGFSTAQTVSDVSGRGVGMDVVKKEIERLNGRLAIASTPGQGTRLTFSLPLTLAIIDGMLVRAGQEKYIIPSLAVVVAFRPEPGDCHTVQNQGEMIRTRQGLLPLIRFDRLFGVATNCQNATEGLVVVVENKGERKCLLLDELLGKEEFVIKNLGESLKGTVGLAGGAILGNGQVGLILDIEGIFQTAA